MPGGSDGRTECGRGRGSHGRGLGFVLEWWKESGARIRETRKAKSKSQLRRGRLIVKKDEKVPAKSLIFQGFVRSGNDYGGKKRKSSERSGLLGGSRTLLQKANCKIMGSKKALL